MCAPNRAGSGIVTGDSRNGFGDVLFSARFFGRRRGPSALHRLAVPVGRLRASSRRITGSGRATLGMRRLDRDDGGRARNRKAFIGVLTSTRIGNDVRPRDPCSGRHEFGIKAVEATIEVDVRSAGERDVPIVRPFNSSYSAPTCYLSMSRAADVQAVVTSRMNFACVVARLRSSRCRWSLGRARGCARSPSGPSHSSPRWSHPPPSPLPTTARSACEVAAQPPPAHRQQSSQTP